MIQNRKTELSDSLSLPLTLPLSRQSATSSKCPCQPAAFGCKLAVVYLSSAYHRKRAEPNNAERRGAAEQLYRVKHLAVLATDPIVTPLQ